MTRIARLTIFSLPALLAGACGDTPHEQAVESRTPIAVRVTQATLAERAARLEAGGVVAASETAVVSSRVVGSVLAVAVRSGDRVRTGDEIVRLDARDVTAQARQADAASRAAEQALTASRSALAAATAEQRLAEASHARIVELRKRNSATAQELDEAEARLAGARARVEAAQAGIDQATAQLASLRAAAEAATITESHSVVRAPFDGVVIERFIDPGTLATPGLPLLRIDADGGRRVDVRVDEARAAYVRTGDRVAVLFDDARPGAGADTEVAGTVTEVARAVVTDQRAFTVKVALPPDVAPRTGSFARVRFEGERRRTVIVPATAVRRHGQVTSVIVVTSGVARIRLVQTGRTDADGTEIVAGLEAGETVAVAPPSGLTDGHPVTIDASPAGARQ